MVSLQNHKLKSVLKYSFVVKLYVLKGLKPSEDGIQLLGGGGAWQCEPPQKSPLKVPHLKIQM